MKRFKKMISKFKKIALASIMFFGMMFSAISCSRDNQISGIKMASEETINVPYGNFNYDGVKVTVTFVNGNTTDINLTEDMIPQTEKLKFFKMGEQEVQVVYRDRYTTTMKVNVILNQFNEVYELVGYECVYDKVPHSVSLNHELPEGAVITYPYGNTFVNAGVYEVVGIISKHGYESKTLKATLTIHQAERDTSAIEFLNTTLIYDGEMKSISVSNVPEGVEVTYDTYNMASGIRINKVVNAGQYRVVAHFNDTNTNYAKIPDREAILTIEKASYDIEDVCVEDYIKEYDGLEYQARLINASKLPTNIKVSFKYYSESGLEVKNNANVGTYKIVAKFSGMELNNYNPIQDMTGTLTVCKKLIKIKDKVRFESKTVNFDGEPHFLEVTDYPKDNVEVQYENNGQIYAGEYKVKAIFVPKKSTETLDITELDSYLIINTIKRSVMVYNEESKKYDKEFSEDNISIVDHKAVVEGYDTETFVLDSIQFYNISDSQVVDPADFVNNTKYSYTVIFKYIDENMNSSVVLSGISGNFTYVEA